MRNLITLRENLIEPLQIKAYIHAVYMVFMLGLYKFHFNTSNLNNISRFQLFTFSWDRFSV